MTKQVAYLALAALSAACAAVPAAAQTSGPATAGPLVGGTPSLAKLEEGPKPGGGGGPAGPYTAVRWNENYAYLKDPSLRSDPFDPIKFLSLTPDDSVWVSIGGQARFRYEYFNNSNFGAGPQDEDGYYLQRYFLHFDVHATKYFRGFFQLKSSLIDNRAGGPRPGLDADEIDVQQAFVDFMLPLNDRGQQIALRAGRQELIYGAQRLVSPLDWTNATRTFEGFKVMADLTKDDHVEGFWTHFVPVDKEELNWNDDNITFAGVYNVLKLPRFLGEKSGTAFDLYGLYQDLNAGAPTDRTTYTVGARLSSKPAPFDFDVEGAYQFGNATAGRDINAYSFAALGGYTFASPLKPRLYVGFDLASGGSNAGGGDYTTFNQLYPLAHAYFGYVDVVGRQNIIDAHPGVEVLLAADKRFVKKLTTSAEYHFFWRQNTNDALYNAGGAALRPDNGTDNQYIGSEIDLLLNWQVDRHLGTYVGYSHFFADSYIDATGPSQDIDFLYAALQYTF